MAIIITVFISSALSWKLWEIQKQSKTQTGGPIWKRRGCLVAQDPRRVPYPGAGAFSAAAMRLRTFWHVRGKAAVAGPSSHGILEEVGLPVALTCERRRANLSEQLLGVKYWAGHCSHTGSVGPSYRRGNGGPQGPVTC